MADKRVLTGDIETIVQELANLISEQQRTIEDLSDRLTAAEEVAKNGFGRFLPHEDLSSREAFAEFITYIADAVEGSAPSDPELRARVRRIAGYIREYSDHEVDRGPALTVIEGGRE